MDNLNANCTGGGILIELKEKKLKEKKREKETP